jgi:nicotinamidase-related amidase
MPAGVTMMLPMPRLNTQNTALLVVDVQEKLLRVMPDAPGLLRNVGFILDVAQLLEIPIIVTEQYPQGLGPTHPNLATKIISGRTTKVTFSCCGGTGFRDTLRQANKPNVLVVGMETHVCVLQTVLDLVTDGMNVFVAVDAVQARFTIDHETALRRMDRASVILTTIETAAFEWLGGADHPQFKAVSKLVQARMAAYK